MNLQQTLQQTDLPRLAACAAHRHVASQAGRETVESFLRYLCELDPVLPEDKEILIPGSWYDAGEKHLTADLYRTADLEKVRMDWKQERFYSWDELASMEPDARKELFNMLAQHILRLWITQLPRGRKHWQRKSGCRTTSPRKNDWISWPLPCWKWRITVLRPMPMTKMWNGWKQPSGNWTRIIPLLPGKRKVPPTKPPWKQNRMNG